MLHARRCPYIHPTHAARTLTPRTLPVLSPHARCAPSAELPYLYAALQADVFETSAKAGHGVGDIFQCIVTHFQTRAQATDAESRNRGLQTGGATQKQGGCC